MAPTTNPTTPKLGDTVTVKPGVLTTGERDPETGDYVTVSEPVEATVGELGAPHGCEWDVWVDFPKSAQWWLGTDGRWVNFSDLEAS